LGVVIVGERKLTLVEQLAFTTVRLECTTGAGATSFGTGFFFDCSEVAERKMPVIVTNRHVVAGSLSGKFHLSAADKDGSPKSGQIVTFELIDFSGWVPHPDPDVDLCVLPVGRLFKRLYGEGRRFFWRDLDFSIIPSDEEMAGLWALQDVILVGYPVGLWDSKNNMPIFRKGVAATHPSVDYQGRKEFLVDAACFPGSSGSPVLLYRPGLGLVGRGGIKIDGNRPKVKLLGILYAIPVHTVDGNIQVVPLPTQVGQVARSEIPTNLGYVIKAERLKEFSRILAAQTER
jgi:hypothetical protein